MSEGLSASDDLSLIKDHAAKIENHDLGISELTERIAGLEADIEYLIEEIGQENQYRSELSAYVEDLREEMAFTRKARKIFGSLAILSSIGLLIAPVALAYSGNDVFASLPDTPKATLLAAMIAGGVGILLTVTRSVYRSASSRAADDLIPPQVRAIHDLTKTPD